MTLSGNITVESSLTGSTMTIKDALVSFGDAYGGSGIVVTKLRIEGSTIQGIGHINSFEQVGYASADTFTDSSITIADSQIAFAAEVFQGNSGSTVLGNSETIRITGSSVSGVDITSGGNGCLGGIFESISIEDSKVYAQSDFAAAIGPSSAAYSSDYFFRLGDNAAFITIEDSVVEAASTYGAAIGMPQLSESYLDNYRPTLNVTISGKSDVAATSVRSAAIGASSSKSAGDDVDGVEIEVGAGDITWGRSSDASPVGRFLSLLGLAGESSLEGDLATAAELLSGCAVTIDDSPTINAKSGVMTGYGDGTFGPGRAVARSEAAAVLWNAAGKPEFGVDESALPADVPAGEWYTGPVAWSLASGVFYGNGDGSFSPAGELTREQAACVLFNRAAAAGEDVSARADLSRFGDAASVSGWAADAVRSVPPRWRGFAPWHPYAGSLSAGPRGASLGFSGRLAAGRPRRCGWAARGQKSSCSPPSLRTAARG